MDIVIVVTGVSFPIGQAARNRILSYSKLLVKRQLRCNILITKPTEKKGEVLNYDITGMIDGVYYEYISQTTIWPDKRERYKKLKIIIRSFIILLLRLFSKKPKVVIVYSYSYAVKQLLTVLRLFLKYRLFYEETEYPKVFKLSKNKLFRKIYCKQFKKADGMVVISQILYRYYKDLGVKNIYHFPMTVDLSRFEFPGSKKYTTNYFVYSGGSGGFLRDGLMDIIKAFKIFNDKLIGYELHIIGNIEKNNPIYINIINFIRENKLDNYVSFKGRKSNDEIPFILRNACGLIMAPPSDFESGGFPTKLGEYLASGTPVICTRVSEIGDFLNENNSFLMEPGNIKGIASAMLNIVNDKIRSNEIGKNGAALAKEMFNAENYIDDFINFILQ